MYSLCMMIQNKNHRLFFMHLAWTVVYDLWICNYYEKGLLRATS